MMIPDCVKRLNMAMADLKNLMVLLCSINIIFRPCLCIINYSFCLQGLQSQKLILSIFTPVLINFICFCVFVFLLAW